MNIGAPPAAVRAMLIEAGFKPKDIDGLELWSRGENTWTWPDAVTSLSMELMRLRQLDTLNPKQFFRTSEFWGSLVLGLSVASTGAMVLAGAIAPAHPELGAALMAASTALGAWYIRARHVEKTLATAEKAKVVPNV